jgi:hypothetical protein
MPIAVAAAPVAVAPVPVVSSTAAEVAPMASSSSTKMVTNDAAKLKIEVLRLEGLVKKLQSELQAEREYSHALENHVKTLQEAD